MFLHFDGVGTFFFDHGVHKIKHLCKLHPFSVRAMSTFFADWCVENNTDQNAAGAFSRFCDSKRKRLKEEEEKKERKKKEKKEKKEKKAKKAKKAKKEKKEEEEAKPEKKKKKKKKEKKAEKKRKKEETMEEQERLRMKKEDNSFIIWNDEDADLWFQLLAFESSVARGDISCHSWPDFFGV
jgi:flagellar biosynthesis GTPase FlhF